MSIPDALSRLVAAAACLFLLNAASPSTLVAQVTTATILGTVQDATGQPLGSAGRITATAGSARLIQLGLRLDW